MRALVCASLFLATVGTALAQDQTHDAAFVAWAREHATALTALEANADGTDLAALRTLIGDASVVALGEPAHGAHEPLALRNRLIAFLVSKCGITAVALETSFTESRAVADYVAGGPGNAREVVHDSFSWGFGEFAENVELIEWLRAYNERGKGSPPVAFYGIDLSGADNHGSFAHARVALDAVLKYLEHADGQGSRALRARIAPKLQYFNPLDYGKLTAQADAELEQVLKAAASYLAQRRSSLVRSSSSRDYDWALRSLVIAQQLQQLLRRLPPSPTDEIRPDDWKDVNIRDAAMADNVRWVLGQNGPKSRIVVFAHNGHVMNAASRGGIWSSFAVAPTMMGQHLRASLGDALRIIGVLASGTQSPLPTAPLLPSSAEAALARLGMPLFLLDFRSASRDSVVQHWLSAVRPIRANFDTEQDVALATAMDATVYIERLSPAHLLGR